MKGTVDSLFVESKCLHQNSELEGSLSICARKSNKFGKQIRISIIELCNFENKMLKAFNNILIVVKQTPYEQYLQLKAQGKAPVALRWERLKNRYTVHRTCVDDVTSIIDNIGIKYSVIGREELHRGSIQDRDLVIAVGGDGTVLNTASFIDDSIPVLGVNSDPSRIEEIRSNEKRDERRSRGALCAITACTVHERLPQILYGAVSPGLRSRIQCLVRSTYTETRLPPSLNDILITQPIPAAVSRFRLQLCKGMAKPSYKTVDDEEEVNRCALFVCLYNISGCFILVLLIWPAI